MFGTDLTSKDVRKDRVDDIQIILKIICTSQCYKQLPNFRKDRK